MLVEGIELLGEQAELSYWQARLAQARGKHESAISLLKQALQRNGEHTNSLLLLASLLHQASLFSEAIDYIERAQASAPHDLNILEQKALTLSELHRYDEAADLFELLIVRRPDDSSFWNNAANLWRNLGQIDKAAEYYHKAMQVTGENDMAYANYLTALHYHPQKSAEQIFATAQEWQPRYAAHLRTNDTHDNDKQPAKKLRIGMFSDGFRAHPVGQMITSMLEQLPRHELELYLYSTNNASDILTRRIQKTATCWMSITHLDEAEFAKQISNDRIDILIDLCGHNSGSRMRTMVRKPAPVQVKWVGGLINTTGVDSIDYLLSDSIETPPGVDHLYTEKLIRMPDDYICYNPPIYTPDITVPPASYTGYITLGCFNNPTKINETLLDHWAGIMHTLPTARLFLKGLQFGSEILKNRVHQYLERAGIEPHRILIEGPSPHNQLLQAYNRVDVALDPWPYSGGLTTCEALFMGVPVVTLPGPTFAGRHSASHLTNAGLEQLVANNWQHYHDIVVNLASDLDNLNNIRTHLRSALLESPVCDAPKMARNFSNAMRAIWQRHCAGKAPAALTLSNESGARFEDDPAPLALQCPPTPTDTDKHDGFHFSFSGKIVALDNGALLSSSHKFAYLHRLGALTTLCLDPGSLIQNAQQLQHNGEFQHYPITTLGDGSEAHINLTVDPANSGTLSPMPAAQLPEVIRTGCETLTTLSVKTLRLDDLDGIETLEWLVLDNLNDLGAILANGVKSLAYPLLVQIRVNFLPTHHGQTLLSDCQQRICELGFDFHGLFNRHKVEACGIDNEQLLFADAVFIPNAGRCYALSNNQRLKLAFLLHSVYESYALAHQLLQNVDIHQAADYLNSLPMNTQDAIHRTQAAAIDEPLETHSAPAAEPAAADWSRVSVLKSGCYTHAPSRVCVGVPIYNEAAYLAETLTSLKRQNLHDVHFLIIDNLSTDQSVALCLEIIGDDDRFTLLQQHENRGAMPNFQAAFALSQSEYFMWLGGHDYLSGDYLVYAAAELDRSPHTAMVLGQPHAVFNGQRHGLVKEALYDFSSDSQLERYLASVARLGNCTVFHSLFRRQALQRHELRKTISADHVLISHLLWHGKLHFLEEACYYRRYFEQRNSTQSERISGNKDYLSRHDFYRFYLDDFARLYRGDERMLRYLEHKILNELELRFGDQGLLENDGLPLH